ncbi:MAG: ABC transporter permease, partial [Alphaproteobacteria bacterium]
MVQTETVTTEASVAATKPDFIHRALRHRAFMIGLVLTGTMIFLALLSLFWTPHSPTEIVISQKLKPPSM